MSKNQSDAVELLRDYLEFKDREVLSAFPNDQLYCIQINKTEEKYIYESFEGRVWRIVSDG